MCCLSWSVALGRQRAGERVNAESELTEAVTEAVFPTLGLSVAQESLCVLAGLDPDDPSYNVPTAVDITGPVDRAALEAACVAVLARHDQLRARVVRGHDGLHQSVVADAGAVFAEVFSVADLRSPPRPSLDEVTNIVAQTPFEITGPLVRIALVTSDENHHRLVLVVHHLVLDGRSKVVLLRDLADAYNAVRRGEPPFTDDGGPTFQQFLAREQKVLTERSEELAEHWRSKIPRTISPALLPWDRAPGRVRGHRGVVASAHVSGALRQRLVDVAKSQKTSLFVLCLTALHALLRRYGNQEAVCVNAVVDTRTPGFEQLVGMLVNSLPIVVESDADTPLPELMARTSAEFWAALFRRDFPLARIVEAVNLPRSQAVDPLFQVVISYDNLHETCAFEGVETSVRRLFHGGARADLVLAVHEIDDGLNLKFEADADLFDDATAERILGHYLAILNGIADDPNRSVADLPLLSPSERRRVVVAPNQTDVIVPPGTIHELFEAAVARTPQRTAVVCDGEALTYAELDARANRLAHRLKARSGVSEVVGLCTKRDFDLVVGVLGILKAGNAYLPLDPNYPPERLSFYLRDSGATVLMTQEHLLDRVPHQGIEVLCLDQDAGELAQFPDSHVESGAAPDDVAYLIYTSGSTGQPKGVVVEHRSVVNLVSWARDAFTERERDRTLASTSLCFDVSVFELFTALCWSTTVVLVPDATALARPHSLEVTLVNAVPSVIGELLASARLPESVLAIALAGEAVTPTVARVCHEAAPNARVINVYGPTEATVYATSAVVPRDATSVTIGLPLWNMSAYVLDHRLQPVPVGVIGELFVGGVGVARGYHKRPDLTTERFVPDPFSGDGHGRLYRTGDRARRLTDGDIEFLGRTDHQVKVRGFRIEPGEVEVALVAHPQVRQAVVTAREDAAGDQRLVAYIVADQPIPTTSELHAHVARSLPQHMVPSVFVFLDAIPLTVNGKTDHKALPAPALRRDLAVELVKPRNPTEEVIAAIWTELLGIDDVGMHDDFFELGGHSLLGTRVMSRIGQAFAIDAPLRVLFDGPSVELMALAVEELIMNEIDQLSDEEAEARLAHYSTGGVGDG